MFLSKLTNKKSLIVFLLLFLFSLPAVFSLFHKGFFQTDDGEWMIIRASAFFQALSDGQFPVRFLGRLNYGYGYPVSNFLYPGLLYLSVPIHLLGVNFVNTIKILFGVGLISSSFFTYFWLARMYKKEAALIGALFYLYTPYHLFDVYKRGSLGEILALAVVPFILWMIEEEKIFLLSFGVFFLLLFHNTLSLLFLPFLFVYIFLRKRTKIKNLVLGFIFGGFMSSFFTLPALFDLQYTNFSTIKISDVSSYFADINLIGFLTIIVIAIGTVVAFLTRAKKTDLSLVLFLTIGALSIFFASGYSSFFWNFLPSAFIQFPFRLLSITILSVSFVASYIVSQVKRKNIFYTFFIIVLFLSAGRFLLPKIFFEKPESLYATNEATTTVQDEYMPKWVKIKPSKHFINKVEVLSGQADVQNLSYNSKKITFALNSTEDSSVRVNTVYYPGWILKINGKYSEIDYSNEYGVMDLGIPMGQNKIELNFKETPFRLAADAISVISLFLLLILRFTRFKNNSLL